MPSSSNLPEQTTSPVGPVSGGHRGDGCGDIDRDFNSIGSVDDTPKRSRGGLYVRSFFAIFGYLWLAGAANSRLSRVSRSGVVDDGAFVRVLPTSSSSATSLSSLSAERYLHRPRRDGEGKTKKKRIVFVIPYRDRSLHWRKFQEAFRSKLHRRQEWDMHYYIIDQNDKLPFRRAWLINIGIAAAIRDFGEENIGCIVTHDVDMLPDENVDYGSCDTPRQMCTEVTKSTIGGPKFKGNIPYEGFAGGVVSANPHHWRSINGMSNVGEGYGYEDDVLWNRLRHRDRLVRLARHLNFGDPIEGYPFTNVSRYDQPTLRRAALGYGRCNQMDDGAHTARVKDQFGWRQSRREALDLSKRNTNWGNTGLNNTHCKVVEDTRDEYRQVRWIKVEQEREKENWLNKITLSKLKDQDRLPTECPRLKPIDPDWGFNSRIYRWDSRRERGTPKGKDRRSREEGGTPPLVYDEEQNAYRPRKE